MFFPMSLPRLAYVRTLKTQVRCLPRRIGIITALVHSFTDVALLPDCLNEAAVILRSFVACLVEEAFDMF